MTAHSSNSPMQLREVKAMSEKLTEGPTIFGVQRGALIAMLVLFLGGGATGTATTQLLGINPDQIDSIEEIAEKNTHRIGVIEQRLGVQEEGQVRITEYLRSNDEKLNQIIGYLKSEDGF